jgi:hypothetical protein
MRNWRNGLGTLAVAMLSVSLLGSCSSFQRNVQLSSERLAQTNDPLSSTFGIAATALRSTVLAAIRQPVTTTKVGFTLFYQRFRFPRFGFGPIV